MPAVQPNAAKTLALRPCSNPVETVKVNTGSRDENDDQGSDRKLESDHFKQLRERDAVGVKPIGLPSGRPLGVSTATFLTLPFPKASLGRCASVQRFVELGRDALEKGCHQPQREIGLEVRILQLPRKLSTVVSQLISETGITCESLLRARAESGYVDWSFFENDLHFLSVQPFD